MTHAHDPARTIAFQGSPGAYSHLACRAVHPELEVLPCGSFDAVFDAVESERAALAMLPVENSQAGRVADIHRLLPERDLYVVGEHYQPIHHHLLAIEGATLGDITEVRSHPQALAQCRQYLLARGLTPLADTDTAGAARRVAALADRSVGAIASSIAGEIYGLTALDAHIEDGHRNTTRFLVMARRPRQLAPNHPEQLVTSCLFRIRNLPAALFKALGGFATNGVNLLKLESYQLGGTFRYTQFLIDIQGHPQQTPVAQALEELEFFSTELRILGSYPAHPDRQIHGSLSP